MAPSAAADIQTQAPSYHLGILFVHGIGDQPRGSTLVEFGTPLVEWLAERAKAVGGRTTVVKAQLGPGDEGGPAHAELLIEAPGSARHWLIAEAWWAESFRAPRFTELVRWAGTVMPWTFGSHFGVRLVRAWRNRPEAGWRRLLWLGNVASAVVSLSGGMVLSLVMLLVLAALLVLGLIPWERLRAAILRFQLRMASSVGDSYVLVTRPIESAAIVSRFGQDFAWLEGQCERVAVVAHSQGGAVSCRALQVLPAGAPRLLVTFGSGLRKLEELEELRGRPGFRRSAVLALTGLILGGLTTAGFSGGLGLVRHGLASWESVAIWLPYAFIGWALFIAGIQDFVGGPEPKGLRKLSETFKQKLERWTDLYASADPVSNGRLHEHADLPPLSVPVVNLGSMRHDHTAYWANRDEFVAHVTDILPEFDAPATPLRFDPVVRKFLSARRQVRVRLLRVAWWTALAAALALLVRYRENWFDVIGWLGQRSVAWVAGTVGWDVDEVPFPTPAAWYHSAGWLSLIAVAYAVARYVWSVWNRQEMERLPPQPRQEMWVIGCPMALAFQVFVAGVAISGGEQQYLGWVTTAAFGFGIAGAISTNWPKPPPGFFLDRAGPADVESHVERLVSLLWRVGFLAALFLGLPWGAFMAVKYFREVLKNYFTPWQPSLVESAAVLLAGLILLSFVLSGLVWLVLRFKTRRAKAEGQGPTDA